MAPRGSPMHPDPPETSDEAAAEAVKGGPGYPEEIEEAWDEADPMAGDAPSG